MMVFERDGVEIFCRFGVCDGVLMVLRSTTVAATSLNNPWPECNQCGTMGSCPSSIWEAITYTMQRFPFYDCGDLIFSGHTVHFVLCGLVWATYASAGKRVEGRAVWVAVVSGLGMLLSCRFHYSIDIVVAFYLTLAVWLLWDYAAKVDLGLPSTLVRWFHGAAPPQL